MESWDCSDLQPRMTGRSRNPKKAKKRTNYSSFPRVQAGFAVIHGLGFIFAAGATSIGGSAQRLLGQRTATAVVAAILLLLTLLLLCVLVRFKKVEIIPRSRTFEMDKWIAERRDSLRRHDILVATAKAAGQKDLDDVLQHDVEQRPLILGNPLEKHRRVNILELGAMTRWTEIRKKNRLVDQGAHAHLNLRTLGIARDELGKRSQEVLSDIHRGGITMHDLMHKISRRSLRSRQSETSSGVDGNSSVEAARDAIRTPTGMIRNHSSKPGSLVERDCFIGQMVPEEDAILSDEEADDPEIDIYGRDALQNHTSHATLKVRPYRGFDEQSVKGGSSRSSNHQSHMATNLGNRSDGSPYSDDHQYKL